MCKTCKSFDSIYKMLYKIYLYELFPFFFENEWCWILHGKRERVKLVKATSNLHYIQNLFISMHLYTSAHLLAQINTQTNLLRVLLNPILYHLLHLYIDYMHTYIYKFMAESFGLLILVLFRAFYRSYFISIIIIWRK